MIPYVTWTQIMHIFKNTVPDNWSSNTKIIMSKWDVFLLPLHIKLYIQLFLHCIIYDLPFSVTLILLTSGSSVQRVHIHFYTVCISETMTFIHAFANILDATCDSSHTQYLEFLDLYKGWPCFFLTLGIHILYFFSAHVPFTSFILHKQYSYSQFIIHHGHVAFDFIQFLLHWPSHIHTGNAGSWIFGHAFTLFMEHSHSNAAFAPVQ